MSQRLRVVEAKGLVQLAGAARLRAASFYEGERASTLVTKREQAFAEGELRRLMQYASEASSGLDTGFRCLVALRGAREDELGDESLAGTLDLESRADWTFPASSTWAAIADQAAVPPELGGSAYLSNVCVTSTMRRQGVGRALLEEAARVAGEELEATEVFAHAFKDDEPSVALYLGSGFTPVGGGGRIASAAGPRPTPLLRRHLPPPP